MKKKIIVDILLFILMLLEFSRGYMTPLLHEIFEVLLIIFLIIHLVLNKHYLKNITKGKYNLSRTIMLITNILFIITFILSLIFGILSSQELFKFLNINNLTIISLHKVFSYLSLIFMGLHLGINFNTMLGIISKKIKNKVILYITELIIVIYGIYSFIKLDILKHVLGIYGFSITIGNIFINIFNYLMIVLMIALIMHNLYKLIKKGEENER